MDCNKAKHPTKQNAEFQARLYNKKKGGDLNVTVYKCDACGAWHIGSKQFAKNKKSWKYKRRGN